MNCVNYSHYCNYSRFGHYTSSCFYLKQRFGDSTEIGTSSVDWAQLSRLFT
jgi:hypothetical protein